MKFDDYDEKNSLSSDIQMIYRKLDDANLPESTIHSELVALRDSVREHIEKNDPAFTFVIMVDTYQDHTKSQFKEALSNLHQAVTFGSVSSTSSDDDDDDDDCDCDNYYEEYQGALREVKALREELEASKRVIENLKS